MDTNEGGGAPGNEEKGADDVLPESDKGPTPDKVASSTKQAPSSTTPVNTLRFGSFAPGSAPSRLWSTRVEADDPAELELPPVPNLVGDVTIAESTPGVRADPDRLAAGGAPGQEVYSVLPTSSYSVELGVRCGKEPRAITPPQDRTIHSGGPG